jgi:hypothetical protein
MVGHGTLVGAAVTSMCLGAATQRSNMQDIAKQKLERSMILFTER